MKSHSIRRISRLLPIAGLLVATTAVAQPHGGPRSDRGFGGPRGGPPPMGGGLHGGRGHGPGKLLHELLDPCGAACRQQGAECRRSTDESVKACAEATCSTAIAAARQACPAGEKPSADSGCRETIHELFTCMEPCLESQRAVVDGCMDNEEACRDACTAATTNP